MTTDAVPHGWVASDVEFGARLALVRQKMGWGNVKEAALACGVPVESWRNWERDGRKPRDVVSVARLISDRTGCDFDWLLRGPDRGLTEDRPIRGYNDTPSLTCDDTHMGSLTYLSGRAA